MGLIREPLDVDFVVDSQPLTEAEKEAISNYIRSYQAKLVHRKRILSTSKRRKKTKV